MMSLWDALRMNMMISYQELVRTFPKKKVVKNAHPTTSNNPISSNIIFMIALQVR